MDNVLVTGGAGFIGTNLIKRLIKNGCNVVSIDNYVTGFKENRQDGCLYIEGDIKNQESILNLQFRDFDKFDMIYHLGALARIQPSIKDPIPAIETNFNGTLNILEYARKNNTPVIYAGSSSKHHGLYGSPYAWSKYGGEELCKLYSEVYDVPTSICRFYNVYGEHMIYDGDYATVIAIFEKQLREGKSLTITGDGEQRRDFTHVDDIVDALIKIKRAMWGEVDMRYSGEEFELGRGKNFSINEIADIFGGKKEYIDARPGEYPTTLCDYSRAKEILEWNPSRNLEDYINGAVNG